MLNNFRNLQMKSTIAWGMVFFDVPLNSVCLFYGEFLYSHSSRLLACSFVVMALSGSIK